ncbi:hypothetical protein [Treponema sp.]|uniref:hypothetical protein n=1 Tax=Treponema sp. TaxID=166 RepID=UPI0025CCE2DD|nr:hypothetical protein [Treponema sp.]MCR5219143.1 hypothetical protein [Treponema sp.]
MKVKNIKNKIAVFASLAFIALAGLSVTSCADAEGLHNQQALMVTFQFENFGEDISGNYSIPGNFDGSDSWDNTNVDVTLKEGSGTSSQIAVTISNIQFSLVPVNAWNRPWYIKGEVEGNGADPSASGALQNFYIDGLDLSAGEVTLVIDASSGTAVPVVE